MFDKILVANRGEIAVRVIRACQEMGIGTVAVYSDADRFSPHVLLAGEAGPHRPAAGRRELPPGCCHHRGGPCHGRPGRSSWIRLHGGEPRVRPARRGGGARLRRPLPEAIAEMGDKTAARARMIGAGVPVIPGSEAVADVDQGVREGDRIGWPVLLKAAAGGGGKGMRVIESSR